MALRLSTALRNFLLSSGSVKDALQNGQINIYSGAQPASPDSAPTGTLLVSITKSGAARTAEVLATGTMTLTGGASGSVNTVTVNSVNIIPDGSVAFNTSLTQTAADVATAINRGLSSPEYEATSSGAVITIKAKRGSGASPNTFVVAGTLTTITATYGAMAGGVAAANGLTLEAASAGSLAKKTTETWQGTAVADGVAGWYRFVGSVADTGLADTTPDQIRLDGSVATSGAQLNMSSTTIVSTAVQTVGTYAIAMAATQS